MRVVSLCCSSKAQKKMCRRLSFVFNIAWSGQLGDEETNVNGVKKSKSSVSKRRTGGRMLFYKLTLPGILNKTSIQITKLRVQSSPTWDHLDKKKRAEFSENQLTAHRKHK